MSDVKGLIERFICPGCVCGSNTSCGKFEKGPVEGKGNCKGHVLGTFILGLGNFALGLPKGFNRPGWKIYPKDTVDCYSQMYINVWPEGSNPGWNNFNVPVWAMEKDGFLFVRTYSPRINETRVDVVEGGTLDLVPGAFDVGTVYDEID